ncbi:MAG: hypothetical protein AAGD07_04890 [Planctomycetota bacterium]
MNSGILFDGRDQLVRSVKSEARQSVEDKYAKELREAGFLRRWSLRHQMKRDVADLVSEKMRDVSPKSLY